MATQHPRLWWDSSSSWTTSSRGNKKEISQGSFTPLSFLLVLFPSSVGAVIAASPDFGARYCRSLLLCVSRWLSSPPQILIRWTYVSDPDACQFNRYRVQLRRCGAIRDSNGKVITADRSFLAMGATSVNKRKVRSGDMFTREITNSMYAVPPSAPDQPIELFTIISSIRLPPYSSNRVGCDAIVGCDVQMQIYSPSSVDNYAAAREEQSQHRRKCQWAFGSMITGHRW